MSPKGLLYLEIGLALALLAGAGLARAKRFRIHGALQSTIVVTNLVMILWIMLPSLRRYISSSAQGSEKWIVYTHATLGALAELSGIYIVLAAGFGWFKLANYKVWMRTTLVVWLCAFGLGACTNKKLNESEVPAPKPATTQAPAPDVASKSDTAAKPVRVTVKNFMFEPKDLKITAGTEVEWYDEGGRHTVNADDDSFKSDTLTAGDTFKHKFDKPGVYKYYCDNHGSAGGHDMAGTVTVQ